MKISDIKIYTVKNKVPNRGGPYFTFLKLITDNNINGYGEIYGVPFRPKVVEKMVEDIFDRYLIGQDPFETESIGRIIYSSNYSQHTDLSIGGVLSGIDMACWDIIGKSVNKPIYKLLGGQVNEKLRTYTYLYPSPDKNGKDPDIIFGNPEIAPERAIDYQKQGFTALKFDPVLPMSAFDPRQLSLKALDNAELVTKNIRDAIGSKCELLIGTHGQMTTSSAIRLAKRLEKYDPLWLEEPVPPENKYEMGRVAQFTSIPIATGERLNTKYDFVDLFNNQAAAIIQPDLGRIGGILEAKKIAGMAEANYVELAPHLYCGPIAAAANIQLSTCSPNFLIQESIEKMDGFHAEILNKPILWQDGYIIPPTEPGLGVELNENIISKNLYDGEEIFIEMVNKPIVD
ncbi:MAG: isomerase [Chloroflexi bacterium]|nr:isomerase [Chloroflexota bacterium]